MNRLALLVVVLALLVCAAAQAQLGGPAPGAPPGGPGVQPGGPMMQPGGPGMQPGGPVGFGRPGWGGRPGFMPPAMPAGGPAAIAVTTKYVYVVSGNVLFQFDAETLALVHCARLMPPPPPPQPAPGAPGVPPPPPPGK